MKQARGRALPDMQPSMCEKAGAAKIPVHIQLLSAERTAGWFGPSAAVRDTEDIAILDKFSVCRLHQLHKSVRCCTCHWVTHLATSPFPAPPALRSRMPAKLLELFSAGSLSHTNTDFQRSLSTSPLSMHPVFLETNSTEKDPCKASIFCFFQNPALPFWFIEFFFKSGAQASAILTYLINTVWLNWQHQRARRRIKKKKKKKPPKSKD